MIHGDLKNIVKLGVLAACLSSFTLGQALHPVSKPGPIDIFASDRMGFIDSSGKLVIGFNFYYVHEFREGLAAVQLVKDGKEGYIDEHGKLVIEPKYDSAFPFSNGRAKVKIDGRWGFIDRNGDLISTPEMDEATNFSAGYAAYRKNGLWGFIGLDGEITIPPKFKLVSPFNDGLAAVVVDKKLGYIDPTGKYVINPQFDIPPVNGHLLMDSIFSEGRIAVFNNGKFRYLDKDFRPISPLKFDRAEPFFQRHGISTS